MATLSILLITGLLFTLVEAARFQEQMKVIQVCADTTIESLFANYNRTLWEQYELLTFNLDTNPEELSELYLQSMLEPEHTSYNLIKAKVTDTELENLLLITDRNGNVFESAVASYLEQNIGSELYERAHEYANRFSVDEDTDSQLSHLIDAGQDELNRNEVSNLHAKDQSASAENPMESVQWFRSQGILRYVMPDDKQISEKTISDSNSLRKRTLQYGDSDEEIDSTVMTETAAFYYLITRLSNFRNTSSGRALDYELEYVILGNSSDAKNLEGIVNRILLIRESLNFTYLMTDQRRCAEAETLATILSAIMLTPEATEVIKMGILAAWAYAESVVDVRTLLAGQKVELYKNSAVWTTNMLNFYDALYGNLKVSDQSNGLGYEEYLAGLLFVTEKEARIMRTLEVMEQTVRLTEADSAFQMDRCVIDTMLTLNYQYVFLFANRSPIQSSYKTEYSYRTNRNRNP